MKRLLTVCALLLFLSHNNVLAQTQDVCGGAVPTYYQNYVVLRQSASHKIAKWDIEAQESNIREIFYMVDLNTIPADNPRLTTSFVIDAIEQAFQVWEDKLYELYQKATVENPGTSYYHIDFTRHDYDESLKGKHGYITITWNSPEDIYSGRACLSWEDDVNGHIESARIDLSSNLLWGDAGSDSGVWDLQGAVIHEIGHTLGLGDYNSIYNHSWKKDIITTQTMEGLSRHFVLCNIKSIRFLTQPTLLRNYLEQCTSFNIRTLEKYDEEGLSKIYYQISNEPSRINLLNPTNTSSMFDPTSNITFRWKHLNYNKCEVKGESFENGDPDCDPIRYKLIIKEDSGIDGYEDDLEVYNDFVKTKFEYLPDTSIQIRRLKLKSPLRYNRTYWWAVWAEDIFGSSSQSPNNWYHFTTLNSTSTNKSPNIPISLSITKGDIINGKVRITFSWNGNDPDGEPLRYKIIIREYSSGGPTIYDNYVNQNYNDVTQFSYPLDIDSRYYWSVFAEDDDGFPSLMASWQDFMTSSASPGVGIYSNGSINQNIYDAYIINGGGEQIGLPFSNNSSEYVHEWNGVTIQDFEGPNGQTAIIDNPSVSEAFLITEGFWTYYKENNGPVLLGAPRSGEYTDGHVTKQRFDKGFLIWDGNLVTPHNCPTPSTYYYDFDWDSFGNPNSHTQACSAPQRYVNNNSDCNDNSDTINPNTVWYEDSDRDGYGNQYSYLTQCNQPPGNYVLNNSDCNDGDSSINIGNTTWYKDYDNDGYSDGTPEQNCKVTVHSV